MALERKLAIIYEHVQSTPSDTWVIVHNLGVYPAVDIFVLYNGDYEKIMPRDVTYDNPNQCTVTFSVARAGYATVV